MRTIVLKESGDFKDISHFFHFMELLFVSVVELKKRDWQPSTISHISIPHWPDVSWKGKEQPHNEWVINKLFPQASVIHEDMKGTDVITVDRARCNHGGINKTWAKYIKNFDPYLWANWIHTPIPPTPIGKPIVTFINRQNAKRRKLSEGMYKNLTNFLKNISNIEFNDIHMEDLSFQEQIEIINKTDLLIGVHGNGLTHAAFMKPHSSVCEIFVPGIQFQWDYYTLSKMMGHEYMCIFDGQPALPFMFNIQKHAVCRQEKFDPVVIRGMIDQIKEEKIF